MKKYYILLALISLTQLAFTQPINDNCNSAESITVSTFPTTISFVIADSSINNEVGCTGTSDNYGDIWYEFTMPVSGNVFINGLYVPNLFALYDSCSGEQIQCGSANVFFTNLTAGTNYKLRVFRSLANVSDTVGLSFSIRVLEKPANDDCATAQSITVSNNELTVNHKIFGASLNNEEDCSGTVQDLLDIWYDFTMPINGKLVISESDWIDAFALYDSCSGTQIQCGTSTQFSNLTAGINYKLRMIREVFYLNGAGSSNSDFTIFVVNSSPNDDCDTSENINLTTSITTINYDIDSAIIEINNADNCSGTSTGNSADIWYDFTMPVNGNLIIDTAFGNDNNYELYDACGETRLNCGSGYFVFHDLFANANYKLRLYRRESDLFEDFWDQTFDISAVEISSNNNCSNSENITISSTPLAIFTNFGGSSLSNNIACADAINVSNVVDLWYNFTMPIDGFIRINMQNPGNGNFFALYDTCNDTEIACFSNQGDFSDLTMGTNYKLRFFDNNLFGRDVDFTIESTDRLGVENKTLEEAVTVYPNPATDYITISISSNQNIIAIECYDLFGKKVLKTNNYRQVDVSKLRSGLYFVKVYTVIGSITKKIIIK